MNSLSKTNCPTTHEKNDCLLTVPEAAAFLHLSPGTLFHWISENRVPFIRFSSRCVRFSKTALLQWLEGLTHSAEKLPPANSFRNRSAKAFCKSISGESK
jgi:excisionase family DNA binding protein